MEFLKRLTILNQQEIDDLFAMPKFDKEDRPYFFSLNDAETLYIKRLASADSKAWFILQLGYFRAKRRFFDIDFSKSYQDLRFLRSGVLDGHRLKNRIPDRQAQVRYRAKILQLTGSQKVNEECREIIRKFLRESARRNLKPRAIFSDLLEFFKGRNLELLDYSSLCDLVGAAIEAEQNRLSRIVQRHSNPMTRKLLAEFLRNDDNDYGFSFIKREAKNLRYREIGEEVKRHEVLASVYPFATDCVQKFRLSTLNIKYLASLATHYKLASLRSFPKGFSSVIICCYVSYRFKKSGMRISSWTWIN